MCVSVCVNVCVSMCVWECVYDSLILCWQRMTGKLHFALKETQRNVYSLNLLWVAYLVSHWARKGKYAISYVLRSPPLLPLKPAPVFPPSSADLANTNAPSADRLPSRPLKTPITDLAGDALAHSLRFLPHGCLSSPLAKPLQLAGSSPEGRPDRCMDICMRISPKRTTQCQAGGQKRIEWEARVWGRELQTF